MKVACSVGPVFEVSRGDCHHQSPTRYHALVPGNKAGGLRELTVPWEEWIDEAHELKLGMYHRREPAEGVERLEPASGGGLQGVTRTISLESTGDAWS